MKRPRLYYSETFNCLRILYPNGKVETLRMAVYSTNRWTKSIFSRETSKSDIKNFKAIHRELVGSSIKYIGEI